MVPPWRESGLLKRECVRDAAPGHEAKKKKEKTGKRQALSFGLNREYTKTYEMIYHIFIFTIVESIKNN